MRQSHIRKPFKLGTSWIFVSREVNFRNSALKWADVANKKIDIEF